MNSTRWPENGAAKLIVLYVTAYMLFLRQLQMKKKNASLPVCIMDFFLFCLLMIVENYTLRWILLLVFLTICKSPLHHKYLNMMSHCLSYPSYWLVI